MPSDMAQKESQPPRSSFIGGQPAAFNRYLANALKTSGHRQRSPRQSGRLAIRQTYLRHEVRGFTTRRTGYGGASTVREGQAASCMSWCTRHDEGHQAGGRRPVRMRALFKHVQKSGKVNASTARAT